MAEDQAIVHVQAQASVGRIIIVRHGKPNLDRDAGPRLNWREYRDWWAAYENAPLDEGQEPPRKLLHAAKNAPFLFASIRPRAIETAIAIAQGRDVKTDDVFIEATLPPPHWPDTRRFFPITWNKIARLARLLGHADEGDEDIKAAKERASRAADKLVATAHQAHDVVLAAHGWFNRML